MDNENNEARLDGTCPGCNRLRIVSRCPECGTEAHLCSGCPDVQERFTASGGCCWGCAEKKFGPVHPNRAVYEVVIRFTYASIPPSFAYRGEDPKRARAAFDDTTMRRDHEGAKTRIAQVTWFHQGEPVATYPQP